MTYSVSVGDPEFTTPEAILKRDLKSFSFEFLGRDSFPFIEVLDLQTYQSMSGIEIGKRKPSKCIRYKPAWQTPIRSSANFIINKVRAWTEHAKGRGGLTSNSSPRLPSCACACTCTYPQYFSFRPTYPYLELKFWLELQYGFKLISFTSEHARGYSFPRHL